MAAKGAAGELGSWGARERGSGDEDVARERGSGGVGEWGTGRVGEGGSGDAAWVKGAGAWLQEGGCGISGWWRTAAISCRRRRKCNLETMF
jgi:hypothetical protein